MAYRYWAIQPPAQSPLLRSTRGGFAWIPGEWSRARCYMVPMPHESLHHTPREGCTCGIYAAKTLAIPVSLASYSSRTIVGRVELGGKVIEHEVGYRAELARVVELLPRPGQESAAEWIAQAYGVPVSDELIRMWSSFPHPPIDLVAVPTRVVHATKPPPARPQGRSRSRYSAPVPWYIRTGRLGLAIGMWMAAQLAVSSAFQPSPTPSSPATTSLQRWPTEVPTICPNRNPLNCYPDLTAMLAQDGITLPPADDTLSPASTTLPVEAPVRPPPS